MTALGTHVRAQRPAALLSARVHAQPRTCLRNLHAAHVFTYEFPAESTGGQADFQDSP